MMFRYAELVQNEWNTCYVGMTECEYVALVTVIKEASVPDLLGVFEILIQCHYFGLSESEGTCL